MAKIEKVAVWRLPDGSYTEDRKTAEEIAFKEAIKESARQWSMDDFHMQPGTAIIDFIAANMEEIYSAGKKAVA